MGIPGFYQWLIERYPRAKAKVLEDPPVMSRGGVRQPVDNMKPNPNGFEFDNLYLDMNGIIHPCFHPEDWQAPKSYDEVFTSMFMYIDHVFSLVRPRKLLFMAIDGVAPRAKMNQQRARRFRAAKDAADAASALRKLRGSRAEIDKSSENKLLDSNLITPGTEFMDLLSSVLQYYIHLKMKYDPGWKGIKVILSDASVPGEGEHKIMSYIRLQRNLPGFDPNTRHCLYGLDADLILLALATHEVHFSVLRENVRRGPVKGRCRKKCIKTKIAKQNFQFLHVWIIREYLAESLKIPDPTVKVDLERLIDDFVFMSLFVGNDFLPHVPSLEISERAIDLLMAVYKKEFVRMGGYLTNAPEVNLERVEHFLQALASHEDAIFKKRTKKKKALKIRAKRFPAQKSSCWIRDTRFVVDKVNLGEEGWKERYYTEKFQVETDDDRERVQKHSVLKFVEGICWVMHYYYQGVCSWQWFYPYHYAPFASDFNGLNQLKVDFVLGKPFKPLDQLMGVLPAASAAALPSLYRNLMTDPSSPILDLYPSEFELDLNGRKQTWKAVCRLPFIDEDRLLTEIAKVEHTLTDAERQRNSLGLDKLFIDMSHPLAEKIFTFWKRNKDNPKLLKAKVKTKINPKLSGGMNGYIYIADKPIRLLTISSPLHDTPSVFRNRVLFVFYKYPDVHPHIPRPPEGVRMPQKTIENQDLLPLPPLWHEDITIVQSELTISPTSPDSVIETCIGEDNGELRKRSHDAIDENIKKKKKRNKKRKLNGAANSCLEQVVQNPI